MNTLDKKSATYIPEEVDHASSPAAQFQALQGVEFESDQSLVGITLVRRQSDYLGLLGHYH